MLFNHQVFSLRNTIFLRLIVTFLLILLPVLSLGVYLYNWLVDTAREDISKTAGSQIEFYLTDLENQIERMKLLQYSLLEDENLNELALTWQTLGTIDRMEHTNSLVKRLFTIQNSSMYIKNVSVHIATIGRSVSALNGALPFDAERYYDIRSEFGRGSQVIEWNGSLFLSAAKQSGTRGREPLFTVEIELDNQKLQEALHQFDTYDGSGTMLLPGRSGVVLTSGTGAVALREFPTFVRQAEEAPLSDSQTVTLSGDRYYLVRADSTKLDFTMYRFIPEWVVQEPRDRFYTWAWLFSILALSMIAVYALSTYKFIHRPLLTLVKSFRRMESGDLDIFLARGPKDEFGYLYDRFNQMVANLRSLIDQAYKQKIMAQRAELKQLQSQINPHFLYNSFFILNTMAKTGDVERVEQFTTLLGSYFQFVTRNASDEIPLKQEIRHARMYAEIQDLRFSRRIGVRFEPLPEEFETLMVPRLIVQPIIENAFEHSLERKVQDGLIIVRFETDEEEVRVVVEDNGDELTDEKLILISHSLQDRDDQAETTGMINIHRRVRMTFGRNGGLQVSRSVLGGLQATLRLPRRRGEVDV
ncbi:sensor histidine kinase [Paenibacillus mucilaginosus]|uniref:Signal transduction histidine kinase, LytS n=1 Tax=Paenibacillus mucilaginosus (strain KNP414) TaxID=1036673 RepID=F8FJM4_PAEMK|nr:histidine kinase [Paenibacillus mucilaginosus]AEI42874.1 signal transduction histidine kinase, LytS [Paenibacillus mucilaginosus KNP414]MCG7216501.1 histidine kinase [Paenibacillus mucilaginosus]WDM31040.1 histidine kinase [Paenibacillus mucilaginosus]